MLTHWYSVRFCEGEYVIFKRASTMAMRVELANRETLGICLWYLINLTTHVPLSSKSGVPLSRADGGHVTFVCQTLSNQLISDKPVLHSLAYFRHCT